MRADSVTIRNYVEKDLDFVIGRHTELYDVEYGLGPEFGGYVEKYSRLFHRDHGDRENMWIAEDGGRPLGVIAIVRADDETAQLRWFLIEPDARGTGLGNRLVKIAIDFCREKGYRRVFLWTLSNLAAARHLYEKHGFSLTETKPNDTWSNDLTEERWDMNLQNPAL